MVILLSDSRNGNGQITGKKKGSVLRDWGVQGRLVQQAHQPITLNWV